MMICLDPELERVPDMSASELALYLRANFADLSEEDGQELEGE